MDTNIALKPEGWLTGLEIYPKGKSTWVAGRLLNNKLLRGRLYRLGEDEVVPRWRNELLLAAEGDAKAPWHYPKAAAEAAVVKASVPNGATDAERVEAARLVSEVAASPESAADEAWLKARMLSLEAKVNEQRRKLDELAEAQAKSNEPKSHDRYYRPTQDEVTEYFISKRMLPEDAKWAAASFIRRYGHTGWRRSWGGVLKPIWYWRQVADADYRDWYGNANKQEELAI